MFRAAVKEYDMLFDQAEIMTLRLIGWCKDVPADIGESFQDAYVFSKECVDILMQQKLVYIVKETQSLRLTPAGYHLLKVAGIECPADKSYEGRENIIARRHMTARVCATMLMAGIDAFTQDISSLSKGGFLSTATLRREKKKNIAGSTKLLGLCNTDVGAYKVYYPDDSRLYYGSEQSTSNTLLSRIGRKSKHDVLYAGTDYSSLCAAMTDKPGQRTNGSISYRQAYDKFLVPVHLLPCNADGAFQLRIMTQPDYRRKLTNVIFNEDEVTPPGSFQCDCDGVYAGSPFIIGIDMDLKRITRGIDAAKQKGVTAYIFFRPCQADAFLKVFQDTGDFKLYVIKDSEIMEVLGFNSALGEPAIGPYVTQKNNILDTQLIHRIHEKHKPGRKRKEPAVPQE